MAIPKGTPKTWDWEELIDQDIPEGIARDAEVDNKVAVHGEGHIVLLPWNYNSIGQGTWVTSGSSSAVCGTWLNSGSKHNGDNFTLKAYLAAGTYTLRVVGYRSSSCPISDIDIDTVEKASFDWYKAAPDQYNYSHDQAGIVIATSGLKDIRVRIDGRHSSAIDWLLVLSYLALWRTA